MIKYPVSSRLTVRFWSGEDKADPVRGQVTRISRPLTCFWVETTQPLTEKLYGFALDLYEITLLEGSARPSTLNADSGTETEVSVESVAAAYRENPEALLAPLVAPGERTHFPGGDAGPDSVSADLLKPWIHSTNRLLHLVDLIAEINSSQETNTLLGTIMRAAQEVMEAEASSLMLVDQDTAELVIALPTGPAESEISGVRIPPGEGFGGWVVENRQPLLIEDASRDSRFFGDVAGSEFQTRDLVCVPITRPQGNVLGALQAINHTADEPFREADVALLSTLAAQAAIALERDRLIKESLQRERLEQELRLASDIQSGCWPREIPQYESVALAGASLPGRHVGGDYYDFIAVDERRVALMIADVSGKGVGAALMMAELRAVLRARLKSSSSLETMVGGVNDVLVDDTPVGKFATLFVCVLDTVDLSLSYVNAGHDPPLLVRSEDIHELREGGPIVGFQKGLPFPAGEETLQPGDLLFLFTDGVSETQRAGEDFFGRDRLIKAILEHRDKSPQDLLELIQARLERFQGDQPQHDDVTMVIARVG